MPLEDLTDAERNLLADLFGEALGRNPAERNAFIESSTSDTRLRGELNSLLDVSEESNSYFDKLSVELITPALIAASDASDDELKIDGTVSHYEIVERIGGGGMGVVFKARDTRLGRTVALKFLPARHASDPIAHARLLAEAQAASALDHPNIGVVYEIGEANNTPFIAMGWYDGTTLKEVIRGGSISSSEIISIAAQVTSALSAAHAAGIVHRDVKPANVLLTTSGSVKLVDFGIAKLIDREMADDRTTAGTPAYMSPEQTRGERVDARTDLWSLGVMLYEMLAGERPFRGSSSSEVINAIRNDEPVYDGVFPGDISPELRSIIERCLAKKPADRFATANELLESLNDCASRSKRSRDRPTKSDEAYELFLKGRNSWNERTRPKLEEALVYFRAALEKDPDFAVAHSALAELYVNMSNFEYMPAEEALVRAGVSADRALALDPSLAEAHSTRGFVLASRSRFEASEESFNKSIELNPKYLWSRHYYTLLLMMMNRVEEAMIQNTAALELDPLALPVNATRGILFSMSEDRTRAREQYEHTLALAPEFPLARYYHGAFEAGEKKYSTAIDSLERALKSAPRFPGVRASLAWCYMELGRIEDASQLIRDLENSVTTERSRINLALGRAVTGQSGIAFEMLQTARWDVPTLIELRANPLLTVFRTDPRYRELMAAAGLAA